MDFFLHCDDLGLTNSRIKSILHLFLKSDLSLPKKNLSLCLNDFCKNVSFLLLQVRDMVLESDAFILELLKFLLELILYVEIIILQLLLQICIFVVEIIELIHLKIKIFLSNFELSDFFLVPLNLRIKSQLFLLENRFLCSELLTVGRKTHVISLF